MKNYKNLPEDLRSRICAIETVEGVLQKKLNFDVAFEAALKKCAHMDPRDRGFAREAAAQLLRRLGQVDHVLQALSDRPLKKITPDRLVMLLRIAAVQMLFMDVRDHAAVDTSVRLAIALGCVKQKGFVNGVLRSLGRQQKELLEKTDVKSNTPDWLYKTWVRDYGADAAAKIADAHLQLGPVDITIKSSSESQTDWAKRLGGVAMPNGQVRLTKSGFVPSLEGYAEGAWWVQSASAALPVQLMSFDEGAHVVDLCAAPGGKTMQLAARGAKVSAVDIARKRLGRIRENLERCDLNAEIEAADGRVWMPKRPVDAVLIDAPCSATGTIRHQPDVLHTKKPGDVRRLIDTQSEILQNASKFVRKGGEIIYCTCSLQKSESEHVIEAFLKENNAFSLKPYTKDDLAWLPDAVTDQGYIRVLPFHDQENGGMDGFFIARVIRA